MLRRSMSGDAFEGYVEQMVLPELRSGDGVLWDNLGAHKRGRFRELTEGIGATVVFLPPYSPNTNPIEPA